MCVKYLSIVPLVVCLAFGAGAENLLVNPGFETVVRGAPQAWQVFVAPMEGAEGRLEEQVATEGQRSIMLHNPEPYAKEPANNWSQNIIADLAGTQLEVSGSIRTDEATEAAIWLQCFRKQPFAVLKMATTSTDSPVYGTKEWTPVKMSVEVPEGTDFVVVRCVLKGSGTAWFDNIDVTQAPDDKKGAANQETAKSATDTKAKSKALVPEEASLDEVMELLAEVPDTKKSSSGLDADVKKQLLDAHRAMVDTNQTLRDMNVILMDQVMTLKDELTALRAELQRVQTAAPHATAQAAPKAAESNSVTPPPLVPHGTKWEELVK